LPMLPPFEAISSDRSAANGRPAPLRLDVRKAALPGFPLLMSGRSLHPIPEHLATPDIWLPALQKTKTSPASKPRPAAPHCIAALPVIFETACSGWLNAPLRAAYRQKSGLLSTFFLFFSPLRQNAPSSPRRRSCSDRQAVITTGPFSPARGGDRHGAGQA